MNLTKPIKSALISVYHKENLDVITELLKKFDVNIYSTGGTQQFLESQGAKVTSIESLTGYPSILGGRVKTLHPKVFGGILARRQNSEDNQQTEQYEIPTFDLVIVDLYPFEKTVASGATESEIIEKIDIGGISLIRAAAKNFKDVAIVAAQSQYELLIDILQKNNGGSTLEDRKLLATHAFATSSDYDSHIFNYFNQNEDLPQLRASFKQGKVLRYGENPHQKGIFFGNLYDMFEQLNGKELSYNNLVDVEAAVALVEEFEQTAFVIVKHTNACGVAIAETPLEAYQKAFACDTISAFGGVIATNRPVDLATALELNKLFFEVLIAPSFEPEALGTLNSKKNRIILQQLQPLKNTAQYKTLLNGVLWQQKDNVVENESQFQKVTEKIPTKNETKALEFALKICKHTKSNTIILAKEDVLIASGVGQTSRVDALEQAIEKAKHFGFSLEGAVMASDAFFPFPDCVEIAHKAGITAVVQPGGSVKDTDSIDYCNKNNLAMVFTGVRHFKH
ncbi:MAG: bifunctional phosphoribosylaminoimidazolecarboxamide formyltransferase/IMP cyclohydrolase PurH [Bacteroidetes bacterium]|nr:MAG: bifunctional phosphoribosylaminoimidazolecarboxamide formyltransferase/IMP cyclohydrolase PurH [Bacteroidota bacterium]TAG88747.1 MAG: bifunctional phosphoribosylaminoimidazolecarboxamide formyltransferase/IMP cyclohydrolase PurH [Bacteroidota bacterium]